MDARIFNDLATRVGAVEEKAERLHRNQADLLFKKWLDNDEVCQTLCITKRTLQTYRENGMLPFCRIRHKVFYKPEDVQKLLESAHHSKS